MIKVRCLGGEQILDGGDTHVCKESYDVALLAAGGVVHGVDEVMTGKLSSAFCAVRPPGHHAGTSTVMGFCLFNNIAVGARYAQQKYGVERVAIIDWDVHHGNGTQHAFYTTDRVLYCSVHQVHGYPGTGYPSERGEGPGKGFTLNAPLEAGSTIADYACIFGEVFCPAISSFRPDAVIISAGQDCLHDDPLGSMDLQPGDFGILTGMLMAAGEVPLALVLEGGYGPSHGEAIRWIFRALEGTPVPAAPGSPQEGTRQVAEFLTGVMKG